MTSRTSGKSVRVDANELVLFDESGLAGDTFIFEPSPAEMALGSMFVVAEAEDRNGVGRELLETVVQALQREYYRDPTRGMLPSFESALHQANLVLYDLVEQGVRDWMGLFHVAVVVLAGTTLHVSTAGESAVLLSRQKRVTSVAAGLSHSPVTDPLRTFSQVASGVLASRDVLFLTTSQFDAIYRHTDLTRFSVDNSAATISLRLQQLYEDRRAVAPLAVLVLTVLPKHLANVNDGGDERDAMAAQSRAPISAGSTLKPRQPLIINRSLFKRLLILLGTMLFKMGRALKRVIWPLVREGSKRGGSVLLTVSKRAGRKAASGIGTMRTGQKDRDPLQVAPQRLSLNVVQSLPRRVVARIKAIYVALPRTSKFFALVAIVLAIALVASLGFLQRKRTEDLAIQQASELLHEARTQKEAAETALIYDNRDQARTLLRDAQDVASEIHSSGLYEEQSRLLLDEITVLRDRLDKVTRVDASVATVLGDFGEVITRESPTTLLYVQGELFSYDPGNNTIAKMTSDGTIDVVSQNTQGIGFFRGGVAHEADKSLILLTNEPGLAIFDVKSELLQKQEIQWPSDNPEITSLASFGNRLYVVDKTSSNIFAYGKTLRGYSGGTPWIEEEGFDAASINSIGVDGNIYTWHDDGTINKLFKGNDTDFALELVDPPLPGTSRLLINEDLRHLYLFDSENKRVVIFDTLGNLNRQIFLGDDAAPVDIAVDPEETTLFILDGTRVLSVSLEE